jgi:hypothetical protein
MEPAMKRTGRRCCKLAPSVMALVLAAIIGAASTVPVRAQDSDGNRGREMQRNHDNRHDNRRDNRYDNRHDNRQRDRDQYEYRSYGRPAYVYSPPPVYYYAPPPGPPVVDLVFPLRFH